MSPTKFAAVLATLPIAAATGQEPAYDGVIRPAAPVWEDAASLAASRGADEAAAAPIRRRAFQNPGALDPQRLFNGVEDATRPLVEAGQEAGRRLEESARGFADGTQRFVDQSGQNLRDGTRSVLNGTSDQLERIVPGADAYGSRPNYFDNPADTRVPPPTTSSRSAPAYDTRQPLRGRADTTSAPRYPSEYDRGAYPTDSRGPELPVANDRYPSRNLTDQFVGVDDYRRDERSSPQPIPRTNRTAATDARFDAFSPEPRLNDSDRFAEEPRRSTVDRFEDYPSRRAAPAWQDTTARSATPDPVDQFARNPIRSTGFADTGAGSADSDVTGWTPGGAPATDQRSAQQTGMAAVNQAGVIDPRASDAWDMDRFLLVVLTAICCYVVIAHLDLRNRYRAALRGVPAGYSASAA